MRSTTSTTPWGALAAGAVCPTRTRQSDCTALRPARSERMLLILRFGPRSRCWCRMAEHEIQLQHVGLTCRSWNRTRLRRPWPHSTQQRIRASSATRQLQELPENFAQPPARSHRTPASRMQACNMGTHPLHETEAQSPTEGYIADGYLADGPSGPFRHGGPEGPF